MTNSTPPALPAVPEAAAALPGGLMWGKMLALHGLSADEDAELGLQIDGESVERPREEWVCVFGEDLGRLPLLVFHPGSREVRYVDSMVADPEKLVAWAVMGLELQAAD